MHTHSLLIISLAAIAVGSSSPPTEAAKITVHSGESIQAAIDFAAPGDVITIEKGTYAENLRIDATKAGLTLKGSSKKAGAILIDARPGAPTGTGPGITVLADFAKIMNLTVRHARGDGVSLTGHGIEVIAADVIIQGVIVERSQVDGIHVTGDRFLAKTCAISGNGKRGIDVSGDDASVLACEVRQHIDGGVFVSGDDATIEDCVIEHVSNGEGIEVSGDDADIDDNQVTGAFAESIQVNGDDAKVDDSVITAGGDDGIDVSGSGFEITDNVITNLLFEADGIRIANALSGLIENNFIDGTGESGVKFTGSSAVEMIDNTLLRCGTGKVPAVSVASSNAALLIMNNVISRSQGDAVRIDGDGHRVVGNKIDGAMEDGVDVDGGNGNTVDGNTIKKCGAEGLENNGAGTIATGNTMKGNRLDLANDGTFGTEVGNVFITGGLTTPPEIDD